jgi:heme exporter protein D
MLNFQFNTLSEFLAMGGYAFYVWSAYLFFAVVLGFNLWLPRHQRGKLVRLLKARQHRQQQQAPNAVPPQQSAQQ